MNFCSSLFLVVVDAGAGVCPASVAVPQVRPAAARSHSTVVHYGKQRDIGTRV